MRSISGTKVFSKKRNSFHFAKSSSAEAFMLDLLQDIIGDQYTAYPLIHWTLAQPIETISRDGDY